jgi:hypothetical protein
MYETVDIHWAPLTDALSIIDLQSIYLLPRDMINQTFKPWQMSIYDEFSIAPTHRRWNKIYYTVNEDPLSSTVLQLTMHLSTTSVMAE